MNTKKYLPFTILVIFILPILSSAEIKSSEPSPDLLDKHNLAGIERLSVSVLPVFTEANEIDIDRRGLESKVEKKLKDAGIDVFAARPVGRKARPAGNIPELRIYIAALKLDPQRYVFYVETSVATMVTIPRKPRFRWSFKTDIWKARPVMTVIAADGIADSLEKAIFPQVDEFILAQQLANTKKTDAKTAAVANAVEKTSTDTLKSQQVSRKFVASKNGKVFHKPDCSFVKRINPENIVTYESAGEAVKAGKRPCKLCKP